MAWLEGGVTAGDLATVRAAVRTAPVEEMPALREQALRNLMVAACLTDPLAAARQAAVSHGIATYYQRPSEGSRQVAMTGAQTRQNRELDRLLLALAPAPQRAAR